MNALFRKEIRLLWPAWAIGAAVVLAPAAAGFVWPNPRLSTLLAGGGLLAVVATLSTFGREFAGHTFQGLLALPVPRARLWWTKVAVLALALTSLYGLWWASFTVCTGHWPKLTEAVSDAQITPLTTALFALVAFTGGLWTTLCFRQVTAALWFVVLLPVALLTAADAVLGRLALTTQQLNTILILLTLAYSAGGFGLAWWLFARAEDNPWTGGTVTLPAWPWFGGRRTPSHRRHRRPFRALLSKEWHLHQPILLLAGLVLVLHLGTLGARTLLGDLSRQPILDALCGAFWGLWLLMPALANATAVAEERKLGILEGQLCQPVGRRRRWLAKFLVATFLGIALGTIAPCLLENPEHLPRFFTNQTHPAGLAPYDPWLTLALITFGIGLVSFHASSLARNTVQALAFAALFAVIGSFLFNALDRPEFLFGTALWSGNLGLVLGYPAIAAALLLLSAGNARQVSISSRRWARNALALAAIFLGTGLAAIGVHHRVWEFALDLDPQHGPPRFHASQIQSLQAHGQISLRTAAGEVFVFPRVYRAYSRAFWNMTFVSEQWSYASLGSNWTSHVTSYFETVAVRTDGTLWASEAVAPTMIRSTDPVPPPAALAQFGSETNWQVVVGDPVAGRSVLLLKTDGTLWRWRVTNHVGHVSILTAGEPQRLGADADWASLTGAGSRVFLTTKDGRIWAPRVLYRRTPAAPASPPDGPERVLAPGLVVNPEDETVSSLNEWSSVAGIANFEVGVKTNGTLWVFGHLPWDRLRTAHPLDDATDWKSVTANMNAGLALKQDGSLWKLDFGNWQEAPRLSRVGRQSDWLAVTSTHDSLVALAADGSLWTWGTYVYRPGGIEIGPSCVPLRIGSLP